MQLPSIRELLGNSESLIRCAACGVLIPKFDIAEYQLRSFDGTIATLAPHCPSCGEFIDDRMFS